MFLNKKILQFRRPLYFLGVLALLLISGCSSRPPVAETHSSARVQVVDVAKRQLGIRYYYGGRSPKSGFDCSGLVYYSHQRSGIKVPRTTREQYRSAQSVSRSALRPGDLVFFRIYGNSVSHVGIYLGSGRFIHAPSTGKKVSIAKLSDSYWRRRYAGGGRI